MQCGDQNDRSQIQARRGETEDVDKKIRMGQWIRSPGVSYGTIAIVSYVTRESAQERLNAVAGK